MRTNNYGKYLAFALACGMAGCAESEPPVASESPAASDLQAASETPPVARPIVPGIYTVCDVGRPTTHDGLTGEHLLKDQKVQIQTIRSDTATAVCLELECPTDLQDPEFSGNVLWMIGDEKGLSTVHSLDHHATTEDKEVTVPHLVQIVNDKGEDEKARSRGCTGRNILTVRFCKFSKDSTDESGPWDCSGDPHGGYAHVEN